MDYMDYRNYKLKLLQKLKHFNIPESEYSFDGGMPSNCLCVEQKADKWEVYFSDGIQKVSHGIFFNGFAAYDFLFYLVMKKHISIKKCWW